MIKKEQILVFAKHYWFAILVTAFVLLYLCIFLLVLFSPKQDELNRGFIPCTQKMAQQILSEEEKGSFKLVKAIVENTYCDTKVVFKGLSDWMAGKQKTPWANYMFEPQIYNQIDATDEELIKFYNENPNISKDMEELDKQRLKLEQMLLEEVVIDDEILPKENSDQEEAEEEIEESEIEENEQSKQEPKSE